MNPHSRSLVHQLIASQLRVDAASIKDTDRFDELGLDPLDLIMVVLRLEAFDTGKSDFPLGSLEHARSVGHLVALVDLWLRRGEQSVRPGACRAGST